jgi:hypothetical protein
MPNQGRMYISQNFVCFTSNIFGYKINLSIPFSNITSLEKKYTALVVPNAIEITCKDGQVHFFGSFLFRDQTYKILETLWHLHTEQFMLRKQSSENTLYEMQSSSSETSEADGAHDNTSDIEEDEEILSTEEEEEEEEVETSTTHKEIETEDLTDITDLTTTATGAEEEEGLETETDTSNVSHIQNNGSTSVKDNVPLSATNGFENVVDTHENIMQDHPLGDLSTNAEVPIIVFANKANESSSTASTNNESSKKSSKNENKNGKSAESKKNGNSKGNNSGDDKGDDEDDKKKKGTNHQEDAADRAEEQEEEEEQSNEGNYEEDDIADLNNLPISDIFPPKDKFKPKEIVNDNLPCTAEDFFFLISADGSEFEKEHHITRGDNDFQASPWANAQDGFGKTRDISFLSPVNNPIGPKITKVKMIQRLIVAKGRHEFVIQSNMHSVDVPYADSFRIIIYIYVKDNLDNKSCNIRIELGVLFLKSTLLRWKIEDTASKETSASYLMWYDQAKNAILVAKENGQLRSQKQKKAKKSTRKPSDKERRRSSRSKKSSTKKKPLQIGTPPIVPPTVSHSTPMASSSPSTSVEESTLSNLLADTVGFLFSLPEKLQGLVNIPAWIIAIICILCVFVVIPRQNRILNSLDKLHNDLQVYKLQTTLFELELNNILFNMSAVTDEKNGVKIRSRAEFEQQLKEWYKHKSEIQKQFLDNDILHQILYQLEMMKQERNRFGPFNQNPHYTAAASQVQQIPSDSFQYYQQYQHQVSQLANSQLNILTWTVIGFLGIIASAVVIKLFFRS